MGKIIYWMDTSIDGFIEDSSGALDFLTPDEDFQRAAADHVRRTAAFLFGRRLYETMEKPWTQELGNEGAPALEREFAQLYKKTPRYVFSDTLRTVPDRSRSSAAKTPSPRWSASSRRPTALSNSAVRSWPFPWWT